MKNLVFVIFIFAVVQFYVHAGIQRIAPSNSEVPNNENPTVIQENINTDANNSVHTVYQSVKSTVHDINQFVSTKFHDLYSLLKGCKNKEQVIEAVRYNLDEDPKFQDPFFVPDMFDKHKLADYNASNVAVKGMANFKHSTLNVEQNKKKANLVLSVDKIIISGTYGFKNILKQNRGPFQIELIGVTYTENLSYEEYGKGIEIIESDAEIKFAKSTRKFENLGWVNKVFEGIIGYRIIHNTLREMTSTIHYQMRSPVLSKLRSLHNIGGEGEGKGGQQDNQFSKLEESFKNIVAEARPVILNYPAFHLAGEAVPINENGYNAEVTDIVVDPMQKFDIDSLQVPLYDSEVQIIFDINVGPISGTTLVVLKQNLDANNITIGFKTDELHLGAILEKKLVENSFFQLQNSHAILSKVNVIVPDVGDENLKRFFQENLPTAIKSALVTRFLMMGQSAIETTLSQQAIEPRMNPSN